MCSGGVVAVHVNSVYRKSNVCCTAMASPLRLSSVDSHPVWYAGVVVLWYTVVSSAATPSHCAGDPLTSLTSGRKDQPLLWEMYSKDIVFSYTGTICGENVLPICKFFSSKINYCCCSLAIP